MRTQVAAGIDYWLEDRLKEIDKQVRQIDATIEKIKDKIDPILQERGRLAKMGKERREAVRKLVLEVHNLREKRQQLLAKRDEIRSESMERAGRVIVVHKRVHSGTAVRIGECLRYIDEDVPGPVKMTPKEETGSINITGA